MARRFSDLDRSVLTILSNGGNPLTSSDTRVSSYWAWKINPSSPAHNLPEGSERDTGRKLDPRFIEPFAVDLAIDQFAKIQISRRTATAATGAIATALGYRTLSTAQKAVSLGKFKPAQVYWRTGEAENSSDRMSRITNKPYKSYYTGADQGYVASFGQVGAATVAERQAAIRAALGPTIGLISFSPEKYAG